MSEQKNDERNYPDLVSVFDIGSLSSDQIQALIKIGIRTLGDLQRYNPFHYARLLQAAFRDEIGSAIVLGTFVDFNYESKSPEELIDAPVGIIEGIGPAKAELFQQYFNIYTVEDLANASLFVDNQP